MNQAGRSVHPHTATSPAGAVAGGVVHRVSGSDGESVEDAPGIHVFRDHDVNRVPAVGTTGAVQVAAQDRGIGSWIPLLKQRLRSAESAVDRGIADHPEAGTRVARGARGSLVGAIGALRHPDLEDGWRCHGIERVLQVDESVGP